MDFLCNLWHSLKFRKNFWLLPILIILLLLGLVQIFTSSTAIAPLIYTLS